MPYMELRDPNMFKHDSDLVPKARFMKTWSAKVGVKELKGLAQRPDIIPTKCLWDELEC